MTETASAGAGLREQHKASTRRALEDAALRRFARDGYDATSVDAIAADAGVSPRTFFRYFTTKDEVLDMGREQRQAMLRACVRDLEADRSAVDVVRHAVVALAAGFGEDRQRVALRQQAAATSVLLRGRLFDTFASWEQTLTGALVERHVDRATGETLAAIGLGVFRTKVARWLREPGTDLAALVEEGFDRIGCDP